MRRFAGREVVSRNRFVTFDPGRFVAFEFPQGWITGRSSYRVQPDGHGDSLLTSRVDLPSRGTATVTIGAGVLAALALLGAAALLLSASRASCSSAGWDSPWE